MLQSWILSCIGPMRINITKLVCKPLKDKNDH